MAEKEKTLTKTDAACQTVLQCSPHFLNADECAVVRSNAICQTEVTADPQQSLTVLLNALKFLNPEEIDAEAIREVEIPRKTKLHFKFPEVTESEHHFDENDERRAPDRHSSIDRHRRHSRSSDLGSRSSNTDRISRDTEHIELYSILKKPSQRKTKHREIENSCQTNLMVFPHILEKDEHAIVSSSISAQTSVTCLPDDSISQIVPKLETYMPHGGKSSSPKEAPSSVLDFIKVLIDEVGSKHEYLAEFQEKSSSILGDLVGPVGSEEKNLSERKIEPNLDENASLCEVELKDTDFDCGCEESSRQENGEEAPAFTNNEVVSVSSNSFVMELINDILDRVPSKAQSVSLIENGQISGSSLDVRRSGVASIQNLIENIVKSVTSQYVIRKSDDDLVKSVSSRNIPNIHINIYMGNLSPTQLNVRPTASVRFDGLRSLKNVPSGLCSQQTSPILDPQATPACLCSETEIQEKINPSTQPKISVNIINQPGAAPGNLCACEEDPDDAIEKCSEGRLLTNIKQKETLDKCTGIGVYSVFSQQEITNQTSICACEESSERNVIERDIRVEENFIVTCKSCRVTNHISSTISNSTFVSITSSKIISQKTTSVLGAEESEPPAELSPCNVCLVEPAISSKTFILDADTVGTMTSSTTKSTNCKCVRDAVRSVDRITIGIGPVERDNNQPGRIAIPLKVTLKRKSESDTVINAISERHASFMVENACCPEPNNQTQTDNALVPVPEVCVVQSEQRVCAVANTYSQLCAPSGSRDSGGTGLLTVASEPQVNEILWTPVEPEQEEKCTVATCQYKKIPGADFMVPWDVIEIPSHINITRVEEEVLAELEVEEKDSETAGCCGKKKKPEPVEQKPPAPEAPPQPEPPQISLVFDQSPCSHNEPYIAALLRESEGISSHDLTWDDIFLPHNVRIKAAPVPIAEEIALRSSANVQQTASAAYPLQSRPELPIRIPKKINLKESIRFIEQETVVETRTVHSILSRTKRPPAAEPTSLYTLYPSTSCFFNSTTFSPVNDKTSAFLAMINFTDEAVEMRTSVSKNKGLSGQKTARFAIEDTTVMYEGDREVQIETTSTSSMQIVEETETIAVRTVKSITTAEATCGSCGGQKTDTALEPSSSNKATCSDSEEVLFSRTIYLKDTLQISVPAKAEKACTPCDMKSPVAELMSKPSAACCMSGKPSGAVRAEPPENVCEPCKMPANSESLASTTERCDPVTLALMACERELKPVRQALNKVRLKLRNMNMPELDCIFKNETKNISRPRTESAYSAPNYIPPVPCKRSVSQFGSDYCFSNYENVQCNCCSCPNDSQEEQPDHYQSIRFKMKFRANANENSSPPARKKNLPFECDDIPCKYDPSVSVMHQNPNLYSYASRENNARTCDENISGSDTDADEPCLTYRKPSRQRKTNRSKSRRCVPPHTCVCDSSCPFLEALKAVLTMDSKKKPTKTNSCAFTKRQTVKKGDKIRFRFKIKPNQPP